MSVYYSKYSRRGKHSSSSNSSPSDIIFWGIVGLLTGTFVTCTLIIIGAMLFYG